MSRSGTTLLMLYVAMISTILGMELDLEFVTLMGILLFFLGSLRIWK